MILVVDLSTTVTVCSRHKGSICSWQRRMYSQYLKPNPVGLVMISSVKLFWKCWTVHGNIVLGYCYSVSKPGCPPSVCTDCNNGVVTKRRYGHIYNRWMSARIDDISCVYVYSAPGLIIAKYDKQNSLQAVCEIRHRSTEILGGWSNIAFSHVTCFCKISSSNVNHNSREFFVFPLVWSMLLQPPACPV